MTKSKRLTINKMTSEEINATEDLCMEEWSWCSYDIKRLLSHIAALEGEISQLRIEESRNADCFQGYEHALDRHIEEIAFLKEGLEEAHYAMYQFKIQTEMHGGDYLPKHAQMINYALDKISPLIKDNKCGLCTISNPCNFENYSNNKEKK